MKKWMEVIDDWNARHPPDMSRVSGTGYAPDPYGLEEIREVESWLRRWCPEDSHEYGL